MSSSIYNVVITAPAPQDAPSDGFVDFRRAESYFTSIATMPGTFSYLLAQAKRRANWRYQFIAQQLAVVGNCYIPVSSIVATGASAIAEASAFSFAVVVEHGDTSLSTQDETALPTVSYLTYPATAGSAIITRLVARALIQAETLETDVFDPTLAATTGNSANAARYGTRVVPLSIGALAATLGDAADMLTVTEVVADSYQ